MKSKLPLSCLLLFLFPLPGFTQPFAIGHTTVTFVDASRNNRNIETEIFYPADAEGDDVPVTTTDGAFPVLAFGHGFVMGYDAYENIWTNLVPQGFIMALPKTEGGLSPSHEEFGKDLAFVIVQLQGLGQNTNSIFFNRVGAKSAVLGHSMGGGAAFLAAGLGAGIDALLVLAPAETNPSAIAAAGALDLPSLIIAGSNDCVTPPNTNQIPMYGALQSNCKTYISINGASHCQMADSNFLCSFGEATCSPSASITRDEQHAIINSYIGDWLKSQLNDDCDAGSTFDLHIASDDAVTFQKNCLLCDQLSVANMQKEQFFVMPNPFSERIEITAPAGLTFQFRMYDALMRQVAQETFTGQAHIDNLAVKEGIYFYTIVLSGSVVKTGKLVRR